MLANTAHTDTRLTETSDYQDQDHPLFDEFDAVRPEDLIWLDALLAQAVAAVAPALAEMREGAPAVAAPDVAPGAVRFTFEGRAENRTQMEEIEALLGDEAAQPSAPPEFWRLIFERTFGYQAYRVRWKRFQDVWNLFDFRSWSPDDQELLGALKEAYDAVQLWWDAPKSDVMEWDALTQRMEPKSKGACPGPVLSPHAERRVQACLHPGIQECSILVDQGEPRVHLTPLPTRGRARIPAYKLAGIRLPPQDDTKSLSGNPSRSEADAGAGQVQKS